MSGIPQRPPGAPPVQPPFSPPPRGAPQPASAPPGFGSPGFSPPRGMQRPPGPPPAAAPLNAHKPPPRAPPPIALNQSAQRPSVEGAQAMKRAKSHVMGKADDDFTAKVSRKDPNMAPPKQNNFVSTPQKKAGAISMFEEEDEPPKSSTPPPSESKAQSNVTPESPLFKRMGPPPGRPPPRMPAPPRGAFASPRGPPPGSPGSPAASPGTGSMMMRTPRPLPPRTNPAGIPEGQPLPPVDRIGVQVKPPAPVRPPPRGFGGGRAPPPEDPEDLQTRMSETFKPQPPTNEPPLLRVKRPKEDETPIKRREKEMPEFESSDEDEENPNFVKQPLPFGVLKQEIPKSSLEIRAEEEKARKAARLAAIRQAEMEKAELEEFGGGDGETQLQLVEVNTEQSESVRPLSVSLRSDAPSDAMKESRVTEFVPAPPPEGASGPVPSAATATSGIGLDLDKHYDDSKLGAMLSRGRLSIRCIEGHDIRRKDDQDKIPRNDTYLKFRLGAAERHQWKSTDVKRKQDANPQFDDELVFFDVLDPAQFIFQEDLQLCIELHNKSTLRDELVGSVTMSVVRFFKQPFVSYTEKVPVYYPGATRTTMKLALEIVFEEARSGLVQVTLYEANGLRNIDPMGQQNPYVQLSLGRNYKKRSKTIKGGRTDPYFEEEDMLLWLDQDNWVQNLKVDLLDEDAKEDKPIGSTEFSLLPYMKNQPDDAKEETYDLFYYVLIDPKDDTEKKEVACGEITLRVRFMPAGKLKITIDRAKDLSFPETHKSADNDTTRMDPYVNLSMEGKAVRMIKRTPADKDGGSDPVWETEIEFDVVDQYQVNLEVMNQAVLGKDTALGFAQISLLAVFRSGFTEYWLSLKQKKANGGIKEVGDIFIRMAFAGPIGIAYPQFRPDLDSFDDTLRKPMAPAVISSDDDSEEETKPIISTNPADDPTDPEVAKQQLVELEKRKQDGEELPPEFSEQEIQAAFKFIDLDRNSFVGAAEIRHILVCMGEMITDEEIDMMISMVDMDGDGQVSYKEFRTLVLHPNPGVADMHKEINKEKDAEIMKEKQALAGKTHGLDLTAFQRQKEITIREQKKKMIVQFVIDNEVDFDYIRNAHLRFLDLLPERRIAGRVHFPEFCKTMDIEPIQEYKNLHKFYDTEEMGDMDVREFLLSMMNFVDVEKEVRVKFSFEMFDESKTGFIAQKEVAEILRGNHMLSLASVQRKAETIMRQAHSNKAGSITLNEFVVVSKKFPNILLPAVGFTPTIASNEVIVA